MAQTHDLGRLYLTTVGPMKRWARPVERTWSAEIEYPFRKGKCVLFHVPGTKTGVAVGWWGQPGDEEETLRLAVGVRNIGPTIIDNETDHDALAT